MRGRRTKSSPPTPREHPSAASQGGAAPAPLQHPVNKEHRVQQHLGEPLHSLVRIALHKPGESRRKPMEEKQNRKWVKLQHLWGLIRQDLFYHYRLYGFIPHIHLAGGRWQHEVLSK